MKKLIFVLICLSLAIYCHANPIPWPPPASMPLEDMHVEIKPGSNGLHALFTGDFTFDYIPMDVFLMLFPVPPDANNIRVWQDDVELPWTWSGQMYPTILPEMPTIPMIVWLGPFPEAGAVFRVDYEHDLIKRPQEFIFFYALGTGKYFPTYEKTTTAYFDIILPDGFRVSGVWLDETPHEYKVIGSHLFITVESGFGPITNDLIVSLVPTTIYVAVDGNDTTGDGSPENPFATIQKGIDSALDGHTVIVQPGIYTGDGNRDIDFLGKAITVRSTDPNDPNIVADTIIDCNGTEENPHRGFHFHSSEDANSILNGVTIINGYVTYDLGSAGGAIYCENGSSPKIINCIITGNEATSWPPIGGGSGGAVFGDNGEISNCLISENSSMYGGGLSQCAGIIRNNIITNNKADFWGGGLSGCDGIIHGNVISHNYAGGHGGGLAYCPAYIHHNIIAYNTAPFGIGGGLYYCDANIENNTIYANSTLNGGGGLADCSGNVSNCVVWSNLPDQIRNVATVQYSDVQDGCQGEGNIDADPCFADPNNGDYHLQSEAGRWDPNSQSWVQDSVTSPCIDAGDPNSDWTAELWPHGKRINMGAYGGTPQASMSLSDIGNIANLDNDVNDIVNLDDLALFVDKWLYQEVLLSEDLDRNGIVNFVDYAVFAQQWLDTLAVKPGIEYEISPCDMGLSATGQSDKTRFTVTVEGRYIHFEDMMVANCCPDKLELQMTVEGNLIMIHEVEYLTMPCFCICNYPVTATLGPFEPGTYTLEVYEDFDGFIGSTTVNIE